MSLLDALLSTAPIYISLSSTSILPPKDRDATVTKDPPTLSPMPSPASPASPPAPNPPCEEREEGEKKVLSRYSYPWPDQIEGLGHRHIQTFTPCANCETGTWAFYGPWPLCLRCANLGRSG